MLRGFILAVLVAAAAPALAQGILPSTINTARISRSSAAHYVTITMPQTGTVATGTIARAIYPFGAGARLVDVIVYQITAGVGGTSYTVDVKNVAGTSLLTTLPVATLASGTDKVTDAIGALAVPSGWTRPVLKTDTTVDTAKGAALSISTIETGTYTTHPVIVVTLVFEPKQ